VDTTARACAALLRRPVVVDIDDTVFLSTVAVFSSATGQKIPRGSVGTCAIGVARGHDAVRLRGRFSLREALDSAVRQAEGVVWLAVEGADGTCGIGLYARDGLRMHRPEAANDDAFCMMQVGKVPPRRR
jgi:hypothetical protein